MAVVARCRLAYGPRHLWVPDCAVVAIKAKLTMRKAYGFRTFRITEIALYHALGKLPEPYATHKFY